jgi:hypothetical protein
VKKLVIASAAMGGAALIAFGASGTFANFTDSASLGGGAGAGTLVLNASGGPAAAVANVTAPGLRPGQSKSYSYYFANAGDMAGTVSLQLANLKDADNDCAGSEGDLGVDANGCGADAVGEFSSTATIFAGVAVVDSAEKCTTRTNTTSVADGQTINALAGKPTEAYKVKAGEGACLVMTITLPGSAGNDVQGDTSTFDIAATLVQATQPVSAQLPAPEPMPFPAPELPVLPLY